jgi:hypothetical protein
MFNDCERGGGDEGLAGLAGSGLLAACLLPACHPKIFENIGTKFCYPILGYYII